jgi:hypothetical protein
MPASAVLDRPRRLDRLRPVRTGSGFVDPLDRAYRQVGLAVPKAVPIEPSDIPLPFRTLLVHERSMTLTLEAHWGPLVLRILSTGTEGASYFRRVLLAQEYSGRPVEMGAIHIDLNAFAPPVRRQIIHDEVPLGRVLHEGGIDYVSRPKVFLSITPNSEMMGVFWMREPRALYGRRTDVLIGRRKVGEIVEILPPA